MENYYVEYSELYHSGQVATNSDLTPIDMIKIFFLGVFLVVALAVILDHWQKVKSRKD